MKNNKINHLIEYSSPILIISYFFVHNIYLVIIGIIFSLYIVNINSINIVIRSITKILITEELPREINKNHNESNPDSMKIKFAKEYSNLTLAETIEELGFIPSADKDDDSKAA